jgi:hypothetical protein
MTFLSVAGLRVRSIKLVLVYTPVPLYLVPAPVSARCLHLGQCIEQPGSYG